MLEVFNKAMAAIRKAKNRARKITAGNSALITEKPTTKTVEVSEEIQENEKPKKNVQRSTKTEKNSSSEPTPAQIKRETLWREYWKEKQRMPNNERKRKGLPMVRRPKRQQWIGGSKTEKKGRCAKCSRKTRNRKKHL